MKKETYKERKRRELEAEREEIRKMIQDDPRTISDAAFQRRERELLIGPTDEE